VVAADQDRLGGQVGEPQQLTQGGADGCFDDLDGAVGTTTGASMVPGSAAAPAARNQLAP
jgi:hypothetical protein